ncbi:hypothetical protein ACUY3R_01845 [Corynebacterium sp. 23_3061]|uniref:hypothetical protein n=1 Tax=Corynebacterium TaxID=1716 RepID=UPI0026513901|nr:MULTISPECIES: hypothetical protein [Corynebacterium]MDN8623710.1 hypothetical protein [Corynebacterium kroppenstedtii]
MKSPIRSWGNCSSVKPTYGLLFSPTLWEDLLLVKPHAGAMYGRNILKTTTTEKT